MPPKPLQNMFAGVRVEAAFLVLVFSFLVLAADGAAAWAGYRQLRAATFPTAEGVVTRSEVKSRPGRAEEGPTHRLDIAYEYEVGGQRHTGTRYSYTEVGTNLPTWHRVRDELPVGSRVSVAYDPYDPSESLLRPGLTGFHLAMAWFLTPFNLVMLVGWVVVVRSGPRFDPTDSRAVVPTPSGWRVRLFNFGRVARFVVALLAITSFGMFAWAFWFDFNPPVWVAVSATAGALAAAALVAAWFTPTWLEVDELARVLRLPARPEAEEVPFDAIRDVVVTPDDPEHPNRYHCELVRSDTAPGAPPTRITTYRWRDGAESFVAWLRERVGVAQPAPTGGAGAAPA